MDKVFDLLNKWNSTRLANALGISRQTLYRYREDPDRMPLGIAKRLARMSDYTLEFTRKERRYEA